ncbi:transglycosylase domain-containing protein [Methylovirgula sp. 4M-Z18]|uniref:transglycosylase domain-containing protein n=1 Tax=Methylovirgula sp. 4M-Z18 TaxID=2293567 RepID=UPI000E2E452E|nr:PBP1A family penicillin-binding protein [Methylovirgula sp. 4M-Z18]RFB78573.1 PBP1A family penicillin-binding protein [Methylovirgula sp. 4M-Z18]
MFDFLKDGVSADDRIAGAPKRKRSPDDDPPKRPKKPKKTVRMARTKRSLARRLAYWCVVLGVWGIIGLAGLITYYAGQLPPIDQLEVPKRPPNIAIVAEDGSLLANRGDTGGAAIHIADLPPYLPKAFVAIEDRRFYHHFGIDPLGIARAVLSDVILRRHVQGGSTLTQQLAKNLFLTQERTLSRKIQEAILAVWLEHKYTKDQILELYLNRVYFGSGAYGVEAAAEKYYGKHASQVTLSEAAVLAGLMKSPSKLAPNHNQDAANARARDVIYAMEKEGFITDAMAKLATAHPAQVAKENNSSSMNYVADYVMDVLDDTVGAIDQDIVVTTTIDPNLQNVGEKALTDVLDKKGGKFNVSQGALVAMNPSGAIKTMIGGRNYADSQFNRAVSAKRQPGSSFKPFVYLAAIERGLTPDTVREDAPLNVKGWQPENYTKRYAGPVTLTRALSQSLNTVAVRLGLEVGAKAIAATAHKLGITSDLDLNASLALGTSEVSPLEMVTAYAPFANGGIAVQPHIIRQVRTAGGQVLYTRKGSSFGRVIDQDALSMMNRMLTETLISGTARGAQLPGWQAAGKTGTSQDYRDAWFIGYTSHMITGVWLGNDDSSPTERTSGGSLPVEIWSRYMRAAHQGVPVASLPGGIWQSPAPPPEEQPDAVVSDMPQPDQVPVRQADVPPDLVPPASIPNAGRDQPPPRRGGGLFEQLFNQ